MKSILLLHNETRKSKADSPPQSMQAHRATHHSTPRPHLKSQSVAKTPRKYFKHLTFLIVCDISPDRWRAVLLYAAIVSAVSYRDAIDRILSIPLSEMIGLPMRGKSPRAEDGGSSFCPDEEDLHLLIDDGTESNVQVTPVERVSIRVGH